MATTITPPRLGPADRGRALALDAYLEAETADGYRYELARGVLEVVQIPDEAHGLIVWLLLGLIRDYERANPGRLLRAGGGAEFRVTLPGARSARHPDVAIVLAGTAPDVRGGRRPAIVMEVVSPGAESHDRDYRQKREDYLAAGVPEYWIVDPEARKVTVLLRDGDAWEERAFADGGRAAGLVLPGFEVDVSAIWPRPETDADDPTPANEPA
jgi:Uma2 family endonuclease